MNISNTASEIVKAIQGKENIREMFHCVTRLRFYLKDSSKVNLDQIKKIDGVIGAQYQTDQLQIIIGNDVSDVYNEITNQIGFVHNEESLKQKKKFQARGIFETLAAIFLPVIPVLAGTGMIKGLITILTTFCGVDAGTDVIQVLSIAGDCVFYFFPFLIAWSAAKRFSTNIPVAMAMAACLLYPTMTAGLANGLEPLSFFGLPIPFVKYAASSIPIILSVFVLSFVYPFVDKFVPKVLRLVFTPMIVILIMCPTTLIALAPIANYLSKGLAEIVRFLFELSPLVAGAVVGGTRSLVVLTGMHLSLGAICIENLSQYGYDVLLPINTMGTLAIVGATLGTWYKSKKTETKSVAFSAFISAFIGITEPGIYGVLLKFKNALIATCIGGGVAGAFVAFFGGRASAYVNSCILSLPVFVGDGFTYVCIGMFIAFAVAFVAVQILGLSEEKKQIKIDSLETKKIDNGVLVVSPMKGKVISLKEVEDNVFSSGDMGKGIAIIPEVGEVIAPFSGTVTAIYPTKHAIGITSDDGVECIIHIGLDTANLKGKYFESKVEQGQKVKVGDVLLKFNIEAIKKEGYSVVSPVIITNYNEYSEFKNNCSENNIVQLEPLFTVVK
ncbi:beta-glucoside-specific PTS transporter subunit IIABC [Clostridium paraputrificum]|uniref:beta-glucoside-specific PTS transporter subunit IIABC n=1 Tax=Clostridium paraputrificum TaxID=29363 RepID=UPI000DCF9B36|nr:beta-glucoside-specific PTS transporter subunit IIABC [Clostridium paraputrificum]